MNVTQILDQLPFRLQARLQSDPFFANIPIVVAEKGNVAAEFQRQQAVITEACGKRGIAVIVLQIIADDIYDGLPAGPMKLKPAFQIVENVELNNDASGTGLSVRMVARQIVLNLKLAAFGGMVQNLKCAKPCIEPVDIKELGERCVSEQVNFECQEASPQQINYCQAPACAQVPSTLTVAITTGTAGAAIWYTTDDSYPYPGGNQQFPGSTAQLYSAPIALQLNVPQIINACVYLPGYIASSVLRWTVTLTSD